ncbi:leucine-rich repeat protein [Intestinibacillus massiliensis]|uniref:leucine-rich repeat protein n=1 Tax=Intestinibacillus massiliensis TaxID=1871029 RepID=UPI000B34B475|nr:leucine-rich repeat protein [Intestinibacillus massiliensis]
MKKQRKWKPYSGKILSMLLSLCLLLGMLPASALAVEGEPEGEAVVECTQAEGCTATEHKEGCPLYEAPPIDEEPVDNETPAEPSPAEPMAAEQVAALITALPEYADATPDDVADIEAAQVAYDALTVEEQAAVDAELVSKLAALTELAENLNAYDPSNDASVYEATPAMSGTCGNPNVNEGKNVTWALTQNNQDIGNPTYTLAISGSGAMADYENGSAMPWRDYKALIKKIVIGDGVTHIGGRAFQDAAAEEITISSTVNSIAERFTQSCNSLMAINVDSSNAYYAVINGALISKDGKTLLRYPSKSDVSEFTIPAGVEVIHPFAFCGNTTLTKVSFPNSILKIGTYAFIQCTGLSDFVLPEGLTTIDDAAFGQCTNFKNVTVPGSVTSLGSHIFSGCTGLEQVFFSNSGSTRNLTLKQTFLDCTNLRAVSLCDGITSITTNAFKNCTSLKTLNLPASVNSITDSPFSGSGLERISLPDSMTQVGQDAFKGATSLKVFSAGNGLSSFATNAFTNCSALSVVNLSAANGVTTVGASAFTTIADESVIYVSTNSIASIFQSNTAYPNYAPIKTALAVTNGGIFSANTTFTANTLATPIKNSHTFGGWYTDDSFTTALESGDPPTAGQTYYAKWVNKIVFDGNGATSGSITEQEIAEGTTANLTANSFTKTGYTFSGWNTEANGAGTSYDDQATAPTGNTTLYAQWTPNTYTISFSGGEGATGSTDSVNATYDATATLTTNGFTKTGYNFAGWDTDSSANEVVYPNKTQVKNLTATASGTITLYAVWTTKTVLAPDVTVQARIYNGAVQAFTLDGTYTITYQRNGQAATPKDAGTYDVVISTAETDTTAAYKNTVYGGLVITPATLTITADNQSIHVGDTLPSYTYKVSGWRGSDGTLTTPPTVTCATADANTTGTYPITASGADAGSNYTITYVDGTLTVSSRPSGGGSGGSSGSSSGVSGSGGNVSVSAGGGSVSNSQMTEAVDKASEGAAIKIKATGSTTVSLPVSGMEKAAANDNHVTVATRSGEVTLSAAAIKGLVEGTSAKQAIQVRVTTATATAAGVDAGTPVFDVSVSVGSTAVHSFDGSLSITLTVSNLSKIENPYVLHILADGTKQYLKPTVKGNQLTVSGIRNLSYFAVIPGSEVPAEPEPLPFTDVAEDFWAYDAISYVYENGLFAGTSESTFSPEVTMTREMLWTVLGRMSGAELTGSGVFEQARQWAVRSGVSDGANGSDTITREQMVTMLYRYAGSPAVNGALTGYADASTVSGYATDAMAWAVGSGIISGTSATTLSPQGSATRAQVATILMRFVENTEK